MCNGPAHGLPELRLIIPTLHRSELTFSRGALLHFGKDEVVREKLAAQVQFPRCGAEGGDGIAAGAGQSDVDKLASRGG